MWDKALESNFKVCEKMQYKHPYLKVVWVGEWSVWENLSWHNLSYSSWDIWTVGAPEGPEAVFEETWALSSDWQDGGTKEDEVLVAPDITASYKFNKHPEIQRIPVGAVVVTDQ